MEPVDLDEIERRQMSLVKAIDARLEKAEQERDEARRIADLLHEAMINSNWDLDLWRPALEAWAARSWK